MKHIDELMKLSQDLTVLYVEDDLLQRAEIAEILHDFFKVVILAKDGQDGLEEFLSHKDESGSYPDLVITDISMPKLTGIEMSQKVLEHNPEQVIIVFSAYNDTNYLLDLINMGIDSYLVKPMRSEPFLQVLRRASKKVNYRKMVLQYTKELEQLAYKDPLTGIANRRRFFEKAGTLFTRNVREQFPYYLFMLDIDKFKIVNDTFGHDMGDEVIKVLVEIVNKEIPEDACFARLGGDEFVIMLKMNKVNASRTIQKIRENINRIHFILNTSISFTVSIGMAEMTSHDRNIDTVIKRADINLYQEKQFKHGPFAVNL
jgi:diguanylate cyclase (GGDEF)-like protein